MGWIGGSTPASIGALRRHLRRIGPAGSAGDLGAGQKRPNIRSGALRALALLVHAQVV